MATEFGLQMMREKSGQRESKSEVLQSTMKELFRRFFQGKEFEGVRANERDELEFSVTLSDGQKHDINDHSSGEKEILFGYLRLGNSSQRNSIILLDEPELLTLRAKCFSDRWFTCHPRLRKVLLDRPNQYIFDITSYRQRWYFVEHVFLKTNNDSPVYRFST